MSSQIFKRYVSAVLVAATLLLSGCMTIPDAIKGGTEPPEQSFGQVKGTPGAWVGKQVRFGGQVVAVKNSQEFSLLEVVSYPLDKYARPRLNSASEGRFLIQVRHFLEPLDYSGHYITVLGTLKGTERGEVDKAPYMFLVIDAQGLQRWHVTQEVIYPGGGVMWTGPLDSYSYPYYPYFSPHGPIWGRGPGWGYGPAQVQTILTE
ncbi:MAG: Slp family lipoprotein [Enterobacteriaceae bacterium]